MFQELECYLEKLINYSKKAKHRKNKSAITLFISKLIESKYLFLLTTPSNIKRAEIIKENFLKEIEIYSNFRNGNKLKPVLYDVLYNEVKKQNPRVINIINLLKEQTIIIKKSEGLQEYFDVLDVEKAMVKSRNHITHKMKTYDWMSLGTARSDLADLMKNLVMESMPFTLEYLYYSHDLEDFYIQMTVTNQLSNENIELLLKKDKYDIQKFIRQRIDEYEKIGKENKFLKNYKLREYGLPLIATNVTELYSSRTGVLRDRFSIVRNDNINTMRFRFTTRIKVLDVEKEIFKYLDNI